MEVVGVLLLGGTVFVAIIALSLAWRKKKIAAWTAHAADLGLDLSDGGSFGHPEMMGRYRGHLVSLGIRVYGSGKHKQTYTRASATLPRETPAGLAVSNEGFFSGVGKLFGAQDIQVGDPMVDEAFVIKGQDEGGVSALMRHEGLFNPLKSLCSGRGGIANGEAWSEAHGWVSEGYALRSQLDDVCDVADAVSEGLGRPAPGLKPKPQLPPPDMESLHRPPPPAAELPPPDPLQKLADRMLLRREREEILALLTEPRVLDLVVEGVENTRGGSGRSLMGTVGAVAVELRYPAERAEELSELKRGDRIGLLARCTGWEDFTRRTVFEVMS